MENTTEIKEQLQKAVDVFCKAKKMEESYMLSAQRLGLQGDKSRLRYESTVNHNLINFLRCDSFDVYGFTLAATEQSAAITEPTSIRAFFESYLLKIESECDALHAIANRLVVMNAQHVAAHLYAKCRCLVDDIKYYRRTILEGHTVNWNPEFIFLHQTTAENIHDTFEEKEKSVGYCY